MTKTERERTVKTLTGCLRVAESGLRANEALQYIYEKEIKRLKEKIVELKKDGI